MVTVDFFYFSAWRGTIYGGIFLLVLLLLFIMNWAPVWFMGKNCWQFTEKKLWTNFMCGLLMKRIEVELRQRLAKFEVDELVPNFFV